MKCYNCNYSNDINKLLCNNCNHRIAIKCPYCGYLNSLLNKFCNICAKEIDIITEVVLSNEEKSEAINSPDQSNIQKKSEIKYQSDRRLCTIMVADISGFTTLSEKMDPEDLQNFMNECYELLGLIIIKYNGFIDKFIGDCVMVLFGAPISYEDDAERAVITAFEMLDALDKFSKEKNIKLTMSIGISTGMVITGEIGYARNISYTVMGSTVNIAFSIEYAAQKGTISELSAIIK